VERAAAGVALAHLGDPRPGVGLRADGLPDIVWCKVGSFHISKYLVTNAQYATFVAAGGYRKKQYWTSAGWTRKEHESWNRPRPYQTPFDLPNHPVVGVSYYEAAAFCAWLSKELGYSVSLPTDKQWTQAAQGDDNREYPWGNKIDPDKANYSDTGIGTTSAVGCFPNGASPYKVLDLSGNVWEWTETEDRAVLRGGAFTTDERNVRCASRIDFSPDVHNLNVGFRVVCGVPHTSDL
jgi:formylglycine-generating enzyme required for sulfatase activity